MNDDDDTEIRDYVRALFGTGNRPPADVVASTGLTREDLERQSANYGKPVTGTIPGEVITDPDGIPIAVTQSRTVTTISGGTIITAAQAEQFGIEPDDLPGITIIPSTRDNQNGAHET